MKSAKELMGITDREFELLNGILREELNRSGIHASDFLKKMKEKQAGTRIGDEKYWFCIGVAFGMHMEG